MAPSQTSPGQSCDTNRRASPENITQSPCRPWNRRSGLTRRTRGPGVCCAVLFSITLLHVSTAYTCIGGIGIVSQVGGSMRKHQENDDEGGHAGKKAPCAINKTYTTYEDRDLGDGGRGSLLTAFDGSQGFGCDELGHCTGSMQAQPLAMLGTDSHGCCCSAGQSGLGLLMNQDEWTLQDTRRFPECDQELQICQNGICGQRVAPCVPEACQFEIIETPAKGTMFAYNDDTTAGEVIANCTAEAPCVVPKRFNYDQPVSTNLVGADGRFETNRLIFRPESGDTGRCYLGEYPNCVMFPTEYWKPVNKELFRYTPIYYQVRTFTWKYVLPQGFPEGGDAREAREFQRTQSNNYVENIEDAYQKLKMYNIWQPIWVEACPCRKFQAVGATMYVDKCEAGGSCARPEVQSNKEGGSMSGEVTLGRLMIIDLRRMLGFDAGTATQCTCADPANSDNRCPETPEEASCYTAEERQVMLAEVAAGCESGACFSQYRSLLKSSGVAYPLERTQSGLSKPARVWTRVVPLNDRPSVGGAGAALRFDGLDDVAAATVDIFPRDAFTVMFWIKGWMSERRNQGVMQFIAEDRGLQLAVYNSDNLEVFVLDSSSGPTGVNVNSDREWHHVAVTWSGPGTFMMNDTYQGPGVVRLFVDCDLTVNQDFPRAAQTNAPGGQSSYNCRHAVNEEGWAFSGKLSKADSRMSASGEVSVGQRMACNATTAKLQREKERAMNLERNETFCRRSVRHECDIAFNATPNIHYPGIYAPESGCIQSVLGLFLSGGSENVTTCAFNASEEYGTITFGPVQKRMALDWSLSNDGDPTTGDVTTPYSIPSVTQRQAQLFLQTECSSGCYKREHALLGYFDELRIYNFTMTMREIAFRSRATVRDGVNCDDLYIPQSSGVPPLRGCSHMIDPIYKFGLLLYWPFDDPFPSYAADSLETVGMFSPFLDLSSPDVAAVRKNRIGNSDSGISYAMTLGAGRNATAPMRVPSTAPVFGARYDFILYARSSVHLIDFKVGDVDTCINTRDILNSFSDSHYTRQDTASYDSHCQNIGIEVLTAGARCDPLCYGMLLRPEVKLECRHPRSGAICAAYPECQGDLCFENSGSKILPSNNAVNMFHMFTGQYIDEGDLTAEGRQAMCVCEEGVCSPVTFQMVTEASGKPSGSLGSYTDYTVKIQDGTRTEYRTVLCHGDQKCDPRQGFPLAGRVITLDRPLSFTPTSESQYFIVKGVYTTSWKAYYFSDQIGGGGIHSDKITFDVYDQPGEAGRLYTNQRLRFFSSLNPDAVGNGEILRWNQPQMQGTIVVGSLGVPLPMDYNVSIPEDSVTIMTMDVVLDDDHHTSQFNLTVNGPHEFALKEAGDYHTSGELSGDMYQVFEVHCGLVKKGSNCSILRDEQLVFATGKSGQEEVTYCDDPTYIESESIMEKLKRSYGAFNHGLISILCTYNENATEIYNVTAYNYTCLPPCLPTLHTYQIFATGCIENCTSNRLDLICHNTYGLYPEQYACTGGEFHGQHCLGFDDVATCFSLTDQRAACQARDLQPGIRPQVTNLKYLLDKSDPAIMIHAIQTGDIHFVDWIHRGVQAVWSELCVDLAASLGYELILRYLIKNGCPWRDSAIEFAKARGKLMIVRYLTMLKPPLGKTSPRCGCPSLTLHERTAGFRRCVPFSKAGFECYEKCGLEPTDDPSCQDGRSNYLAPDVDTRITQATEMGAFLIKDIEVPASARCSTGSKTALIRGPQIKFLSNDTDVGLRLYQGSYVGFSDKAIVCEGMAETFRGEAPLAKCKDPGKWPGFVSGGRLIDFLNFHVSDQYMRVLYIPPPGKTGFTATFNYTVSRMTSHPQQYSGSPVEGRPVAARTGTVNIFVSPSNDYPDPVTHNSSYRMREDALTVMKLQWVDVDSARKDVRVYIKEFPRHGDLYQVVDFTQTLNRSRGYNYSAHLLDPKLCETVSPDCLSGNCDQPKDNCYYLDEKFVIGEPIPRQDVTISQSPSAIYNTTQATIHPLLTAGATECFETDRFGGLDMDHWAGEVFCDMPYLDDVPSTCRRCMTAAASRTKLPPGSWSGRLIYDPIYTQRQDETKPIDAPNVISKGGLCTLSEQCKLGGNTESKGSCIDWQSLGPTGRPTPYKDTPMVVKNQSQSGPFWRPWSWSEINADAPYPCDALSAGDCLREAGYLWPGYYEPARVTRAYSSQANDAVPPYINLTLTKYGDPVDSESFYSICKERDVHQFMAEYPDDVFMKGFDMHLSLPDNIFFRVLAWTSRFQSQDIYETHELSNVTRKVRQDKLRGPKTFVTYTFSTTQRMQRKRSVTKCAGEEWREVWRGYSEEGRPLRTSAESTQQGRHVDHSNLRFRFHPTNFTTKRLLVQSCGWMYRSAHNGDPGNPLDSFENLMLVGARGSKPRALVSDAVHHRIAYMPHPHFTGRDSFSFYGDEAQQFCQGRECKDRKDLKVATINIDVVNTNDAPQPSWMEVTGGPGETIEFDLVGVDASPDAGLGWIEWGYLGLGAGQASRGGIGPMGVVDSYRHGDADFLGSPDQEPDSELAVLIVQQPQVGILSQVAGRRFRYSPPANAGGKPLASFTFNMRDKQGIVSPKTGTVYINYICEAGYFVNQLMKTCSPCPKGFFKPRTDDRTSCFTCQTGSYSPQTGLTACLKCAPGKYQPRVASSDCMKCRIGHFTAEDGSDRCLPCSPGTFAPRMNATSCLHCGSLSYAPLPGMFRCYDCPRLSWSSVTDSSDVGNCVCFQGTYRNAIFNSSVNQLWSPDNLGVDNASYITPTVNAIKEPWPERLQLIASNCSKCPEGSFCHGANLPPVAKTAFWTDWKTPEKKFWETYIDAKFYKCDANNVREVCLGYPALDIQEQNQLCRLRTNWGFCDDWPNINWSQPPDAARCKAGYEDVICSKCIGYELQQCVPKDSDADDGWFSWKKNARARSFASYFRQPLVDCYAFGACKPDDPGEECDSKRDMCLKNEDQCKWQTSRYYRSFDGVCAVCPLSVFAGFFFYLIWFAIYCVVVLAILALALTDMTSFSITFTFWQTAALLARYRIAWPENAQSLLSLYSLANVNLDGIPWMCFFNSAPGFGQIWILTMLSIGGLVGGSIVRWILPFLAVPPRGKVLLGQFKGALARRDMLKGVGSVARVQYLQKRSNQTDNTRPSSVAPSQRSRRPSTAPSRPSTGGSRGPSNLQARRPTSAFSAAKSQGSLRNADDIVIEEEADGPMQSGRHGGASFGSPFTTDISETRRPATLAEHLPWGPRSRASLIPAASLEEDRLEELPGTTSTKRTAQPESKDKLGSSKFGDDMMLEDIEEDVVAANGASPSSSEMMLEASRTNQLLEQQVNKVLQHRASARKPLYESGAIRVSGGSFGIDFSKLRSATPKASGVSSTARDASTEGQEADGGAGTAASNADRPQHALDVVASQEGESHTSGGSAASHDPLNQDPAPDAAAPGLPHADTKKRENEGGGGVGSSLKAAGSKLAAFSKEGALAAVAKTRAGLENITVDTESSGAEEVSGAPEGGVEDAQNLHAASDGSPSKAALTDVKARGAKMFSLAKTAGNLVVSKAADQAQKAKDKAAKLGAESAAAAKELRDNPDAFKAKLKQKRGILSFLSPSKKPGNADVASVADAENPSQPPEQQQKESRLPVDASKKLRPRSALRPPRAPDVLVLEDIDEVSALSRPISAVSRPWCAVSGRSGLSRPESAKSVSFHNTPASSGPGTAGRRMVRGATDMGDLADIAGHMTPSRLQRERDGWREYRTSNPFQAHTPRMEQRLNSARSDGSSKDVPMDLGGIAWYVRKQYFDMAWRHAVAMLSILYICGCQKTLQALKWTWWTWSPVSKTAVLDYDPSVRIFEAEHTPIFLFALMALPITVCGPVINLLMLYTGYKFRSLDDTSFSMRWGYLLDPFERKYWFWSIVVAARKFVFVFAQTFLRNSLYQQKFFPALTICINIILNYSLRPYRVERHNVYENILLVCLLFILLLGMITPLDITLYHDSRGRNLPGIYDTVIDIGILTIQAIAFLVSLVCIYADILDAQLRTPKLIKMLYLLTLGPVELVFRIVRNVLEILLGALWWLLGKMHFRRGAGAQAEGAETPTSSARERIKKKKGKSRYINPQALNRGSGDPPLVTGNRYADIMWEKVFGKYRTKKVTKVLNSLDDDYDELVRPDDGAQWLRDKFSIRKRMFVLERRLQREALYDPKNTTILRMERQLTVALDASAAQLKREYEAYFDQLYDAQTEYEAICIDRDDAKRMLDQQEKNLEKTEDAAKFAQAKLDATIRRTGQPEDWKRRFLEEQAKRLALEEEIVDLQAQVEIIRLENEDEESP